ncbi:MAG: Ribonuclease E [Alphaproteobacteria bacterium ADurb.Bin438]|nr:MAG: Ribonuclease E [Alphaproteobacteria bacterium ADurb.Bin438]
MELIVNFKEEIFEYVVLNDNKELVKYSTINPILDQDDIVCGRVIQKSPLKETFFIEYQKGKTGLLIKASGFKIGDKVICKLIRNEIPPFKSAKLMPYKIDEDLEVYEIKKSNSKLLEIINEYNIDEITCNPSVFASIFKGKAKLNSKPFDEVLIEEISELKNPIINLKNGARIIIEQTAAFCAIDVDSASSNDNTDEINLIAVKEIVRQLILREIKGIILIDFIGHSFNKNLTEVINYLKSQKDVLKFISVTKLNLIEIMRKY